ncbi:MAG TPA: hypothetical protein VL987_12190 [Cellvibrio sp.]|nr:hypothetical protein [Cellvibrio sp.]
MEPPDCNLQMPGSQWDTYGEACVCPTGTTQGYSGTVGGGLQQSCINQNPQEGCPAGSYQIQIDGVDQCWTPDPPDTCPEGSYPVTMNGVEQCWTPDEGQENCPTGTYYVEINGVGQCYNPQPNIDDPDDPGSSSSTSSGGSSGSTSSSGGTVGGGGEFDDSRIVGRLDQIRNKIDSTNTKLDTANETLTGIKDILDGDAQPMPGHSQATVATFAGVNQAFYGRLVSSPIGNAFSGVSSLVNLAGAECPEFSVELPEPIGITASTALHCEVYLSVASVFSVVMYAVYAFTAFRIFASA